MSKYLIKKINVYLSNSDSSKMTRDLEIVEALKKVYKNKKITNLLKVSRLQKHDIKNDTYQESCEWKEPKHHFWFQQTLRESYQ